MALTHLENIVSAKPRTATGGILKGTVASAVPTDATTALDASFIPLGYVTDKGVSVKPSVSTTDKKAWGGYVVRTLSTETNVDMEFSLYEFLNPDSIKAAYGPDNVVITGDTFALKFDGTLPAPVPYVIEARDGTKQIRLVIPRFQVVDQGELLFDDNETLDLNLKGKAYPDDSGALFYCYVNTATTTTI